MRKIPVFKAEVEAGVAGAVMASASISYLCPITKIEATESIRQVAQAHAARPIEDATLIHFEDILATSGWNLNRDVFTREELWASRHTIDHKPINMSHAYTNIVGHVAGSQAVDFAYAPIADDTPFDDLPDAFHVKNLSYLYRYVGDAERDEFMANLEREIEAGEWCVSMESYFSGFDYGLWSEDDDSRAILKRDNATAFLTKHMWQYGGDGSYADPVTGRKFKLGRVLKGVHFKGKGLVKEPGNAHSVIFARTEAFREAYAELGYLSAAGCKPVEITTQETHSMSEPAKNDGDAQTIQALRDEIKALKDSASESKAAELTARITILEADKTSLQAEVSRLQADVEAKADEIREQGVKATEAETKLADAQAALDVFRKAEARAARIAVLAESKAPAAIVEQLADDLSPLGDEAFRSAVASLAKAWGQEAAAPEPAAAAAPKASVQADKDAIDAATPEPETTPPVAEASAAADPKLASAAVLSKFFTAGRSAV